MPSTALKLHGPSFHGDGCTKSTISARLFARAHAENMQLVVMTVSGSFVDQRLRKPLLGFGVQNSNMASKRPKLEASVTASGLLSNELS